MTTTDRGPRYDPPGPPTEHDDRDLVPGADETYFEDPGHYGIEPDQPWPEDVPHGQNDLHWRYEDDPVGARRAERRIAFLWSLTLLCGFGLGWVYVAGGQAQIEGACLFVGFGALGLGLVLWARDLLPGHDVVASRGGLTHHSPENERRIAVQALGRGLEPIARRPFLGKVLGASLTVFGVGLVFPIASLGPRVNGQLARTGWRRGIRAVSGDGLPVRPSDIAIDGVLTVFPDTGIDPTAPSMAQASTLLINIGSAPFEVRPGRETWHIGAVGSASCIVAFSKICTHAGCPVSLYSALYYQLVCPCHQSTFDVLSDCKPVFGPAPRNLAQLPLAVDAEGYIISQSDYTEPVGPGYWNRPNRLNPRQIQ